MARAKRVETPDGVYHVTSRAVADMALFRSAEDFSLFHSLLQRTIRRARWIPHAFCLMTTHYHVIIGTPEANLAAGMHWLNGRYAQLFYERWGHTGHVFFRRYAAAVIESDEYFEAACQYVLDNPVKAGLCTRSEDWPWSGLFID